ncbi:MAG: primosomal protein N' (replication factor Y) [Acidimicrobiales bacterium]
MVPDVSGLDKEFDYLAPERWADIVDVGSLVRVELHNRRVAGWVVAADVEPPEGVVLREITKVSSVGPSAEVIELARWAGHRWRGRLASILKTASPDKMIDLLPAPPAPARVVPTDLADPVAALAAEAVSKPGVTVVRVAPDTDLLPFYAAAASCGDAIIVMPGVADARFNGARYRRAGGRIALAGRDWALGATGGLVTGARSAVWATVPQLGCMLVIDEHDESLQEERNPTWHARDVAVERARRAGVPCVLVSAAPSAAAIGAADRVLSLSRSDERAGWPLVQVVDRRQEDPGKPGLFSSELVDLVRSPGRVLCVLNRKGRAQMLACASCGELVRTEDGNQLMAEMDGELVSFSGERRPLVCANCSGTKLKRLRLGVNRAREELEVLAGEPVGELTAETSAADIERLRIMVGTEALLHRVHVADAVCFLDFDQELLATRYRTAEQAMGLVVRAARLVGSRAGGGRIMLQTRTPEHRVVTAAVRSDTDRFVTEELAIRQSMGFPPYGALAEVSGAAAAELLEPLVSGPGVGEVNVMGPRPDGRYLVRAADPDTLADVLCSLERPKGRVRVAIDPPRV